jgi:flagellar assembly factor FliW
MVLHIENNIVFFILLDPYVIKTDYIFFITKKICNKSIKVRALKNGLDYRFYDFCQIFKKS